MKPKHGTKAWMKYIRRLRGKRTRARKKRSRAIVARFNNTSFGAKVVRNPKRVIKFKTRHGMMFPKSAFNPIRTAPRYAVGPFNFKTKGRRHVDKFLTKLSFGNKPVSLISTGLKTNVIVYEHGRKIKQHNFGQSGKIFVGRHSVKVVFKRSFRFDHIRQEFLN